MILTGPLGAAPEIYRAFETLGADRELLGTQFRSTGT